MKSRYAMAWASFVEDWLCIRLPFRNYEVALIDFARSSLDEEENRPLESDLANIKRAARSNESRMVLLPPRRGTTAAGSRGEDDHILAACRLKSRLTGKSVRGLLIAYAGASSPHGVLPLAACHLG